ncbi:hypothetical protein ACVW1A_000303 [Bradyrhizobium sp. LB1.3]
MATHDHDNRSSHTAEPVDEAVRRTGESAAEQIKHIWEMAVEAGQEMNRIGPELLRQNAEAFQDAMRVRSEMTAAAMGRSTDQFALPGLWSGLLQATERSAGNAAATLQCTSAVTQATSEMSREYCAFVRHQMEITMTCIKKFWACRTPTEIAVLQSEFLRETVQGLVESNRRVVGIMSKVDETAKRMAKNTHWPAA